MRSSASNCGTKSKRNLSGTDDSGPENVGNIASGFNDGVSILIFAPKSIGIGVLNASSTPKACVTPSIV